MPIYKVKKRNWDYMSEEERAEFWTEFKALGIVFVMALAATALATWIFDV